MKNKNVSYQEHLIESLKNPVEAEAYLNAALVDEDQRVFLLALKNVIEAQGIEITEISKKTNLNRENLYRMLSLKGNPKFINILSVLQAVGLQLEVKNLKN